MNDQSLAPVTSNGGLRYPLKVRPEPGQAIEVAPGVHWLRMPLPMALNHINLWALEDGDGWTLVDTGMQTAEIAAAWENVITGPMAGRPVKRVRDHTVATSRSSPVRAPVVDSAARRSAFQDAPSDRTAPSRR